MKRKAKIADKMEKMALRFEAEVMRRLQEQETVKMKMDEKEKKEDQEIEMMRLSIEYKREQANAEMDVLEKKEKLVFQIV